MRNARFTPMTALRKQRRVTSKLPRKEWMRRAEERMTTHSILYRRARRAGSAWKSERASTAGPSQ
ncbi:MAG: hypothetical protein JWL65_2702 [Gammaproteobacteria bacterium]|nr:hypothetical protein [Gammaproteobacteria bacterium]